jgi:hypothetical protein
MSSARVGFPTGIDEMAQDWLTGTYRILLTDPDWSPDPSVDVFVSDITPFEYGATGYVRQTLGTKTRDIVLPATADDPGYTVFDCADPTFGVLSGGDVAAWIAAYKFVTNDADSPLALAFRCNYTADGTTEAVFTVSVNGLYRASTVCPNDFS